MGTPRTILLVDDDADFLAMNRAVLESAGYAVVCAASADEARALLSQQRADLIVTDLMMGALDSGFAFAAGLKADPATQAIPVIMATSVGRHAGLDFRPRSSDELAQMNVDAYFDKPVRPVVLLNTIAELLNR